MDIKKIVITGGPCAGKTTALSWIQNTFTRLGYRVFFISETATELISGGVSPQTCGSNLDFQKCQVKLQLEREEIYEQAARSTKADHVLLVCDRGVIDNKAYMTEEEFHEVLHTYHLNEAQLRENYDAVFHLVTAADGAPAYYTLANNKARRETPEQAIEVDRKILAAWTGHPHLRIIDNSGDFDSKMKRVIAEITSFLGAPEPQRFERKYLIQRPSESLLCSLPGCKSSEIVQTYLSTDDGHERRLRQREEDGAYLYYATDRVVLSNQKRIEIEKRLTESEYVHLLMKADPDLRPIRKTRYSLMMDNIGYIVDIYPSWPDKAILEAHLTHEDDSFTMPSFVKVIKEVTGDPAYTNFHLAKTGMNPEAEVVPQK